jgi:putative phosphoribosyl transferase
MLFSDRSDAGRRLARRLERLRGEDVVVLGLPRGGVPVAFEIAEALDAPLDVIVVRKLPVPSQPELGMGAIGEGGVRIVNEAIVRAALVSARELTTIETVERAELDRQLGCYRGGRQRVPLIGRTAIVVDDGIATGATAWAACRVARLLGARRVVMAVPVAPPRWTVELRDVADQQICLDTPAPFYGIGEWYRDFTQVTDAEVADYLARRAGGSAGAVLPSTEPRAS